MQFSANINCPLCGVRMGFRAQKEKIQHHKTHCIPLLMAQNKPRKAPQKLTEARAIRVATYFKQREA